MAGLVLLAGCSVAPKTPCGPSFADLYRECVSGPRAVAASAPSGPLLTLSASGMTLEAFARWLAHEAGVSIVLAEGLERRAVTLELKEQSLDQVLNLVSRRVGVDIIQIGSVYYLGALRLEDRVLLVRKVRGASVADIGSAADVVASDSGRRFISRDGLLVVGDRLSVITRLNDLIDKLEAADRSLWVVQLYIVSLADADLLDLGVDVEPGFSLAVGLAGLSPSPGGNDIAGNLKGELLLKGLLRASRDVQGVEMVSKPLFVLGDGGSSELTSGEVIPVPRRVVSPEGTVSTVQYESTSVGLTIKADVREMAGESAELGLVFGLSELAGYVGEAPILKRVSWEGRAVVRSAGVYLLAEISRQDQSRQDRGVFPGLSGRREKRGSVVQIWGRAYRVGSPVSVAHPATEPVR